MAHGSVDWFQIDTDDAEGTERFYGELFAWTFSNDPHTPAYRLVTQKGAQGPQGGTFSGTQNRAAFFVAVDDVAAAATQAEQLGGKVVDPPRTTPNGLTFAHLLDPAGNHFGVYTPIAG
jgi:predicted enzyme related to lactoylglutathione lyase